MIYENYLQFGRNAHLINEAYAKMYSRHPVRMVCEAATKKPKNAKKGKKGELSPEDEKLLRDVVGQEKQGLFAADPAMLDYAGDNSRTKEVVGSDEDAIGITTDDDDDTDTNLDDEHDDGHLMGNVERSERKKAKEERQREKAEKARLKAELDAAKREAKTARTQAEGEAHAKRIAKLEAELNQIEPTGDRGYNDWVGRRYLWSKTPEMSQREFALWQNPWLKDQPGFDTYQFPDERPGYKAPEDRLSLEEILSSWEQYDKKRKEERAEEFFNDVILSNEVYFDTYYDLEELKKHKMEIYEACLNLAFDDFEFNAPEELKAMSYDEMNKVARAYITDVLPGISGCAPINLNTNGETAMEFEDDVEDDYSKEIDDLSELQKEWAKGNYSSRIGKHAKEELLAALRRGENPLPKHSAYNGEDTAAEIVPDDELPPKDIVGNIDEEPSNPKKKRVSMKNDRGNKDFQIRIFAYTRPDDFESRPPREKKYVKEDYIIPDDFPIEYKTWEEASSALDKFMKNDIPYDQYPRTVFLGTVVDLNMLDEADDNWMVPVVDDEGNYVYKKNGTMMKKKIDPVIHSVSSGRPRDAQLAYSYATGIWPRRGLGEELPSGYHKPNAFLNIPHKFFRDSNQKKLLSTEELAAINKARQNREAQTGSGYDVSQPTSDIPFYGT